MAVVPEVETEAMQTSAICKTGMGEYLAKSGYQWCEVLQGTAITPHPALTSKSMLAHMAANGLAPWPKMARLRSGT